MSYHRNDRKCEPQDCEFYSYQESDSLRILRKFRDIYENELHKIDSKGGGDCLQAKINLQEQWIHDLTEQNEMMAKTVEKLECEATERVKMLEAKLKSNAECICEVMQRYSQLNDSLNLDEPFQKLFYFENDIKSLLEFIRRIREDHCWSIDGLKFYDVTHCDLFGSQQFCTTSTCPPTREKDETCVKKEEALEKHKEELSSLREITDKKDEELDHLKRGSLDLQSENSRLKIEISEDRTRFKEHLKQKEELQVKLKEEKKEKENMVNILSQERQKNSGICSKNLKQIAELKQEIEQLKLDLEKSKKAKETLERKCNELEHELNDSKRRNSSLLDENSLIDEIKKKNKSLQDEVDDLSTTVIDHKNQLAILLNKTMKQDESEDLHTMKEKLLVQITELKLKIAELEIELADERDRRGEKTIICRGDPAKEIARISQVNQTDEIMDSDKHEATEESADEDENRQKRRCSKCRLKKEKTVQIQISKMQSQRDEILQTLITDNKEEHHCQTDIKSEEMQIMLENCQKRADNLQKAVDYYINSVTILEAAEEKAKIQIEEQKMTICALQEALVDAKRELDEFKRNNNEEVSYSVWGKWFGNNLTNLNKPIHKEIVHDV